MDGMPQKKREFAKRVQMSAPMWDQESFEAKRKQQMESCIGFDEKADVVYRTYAAIAKPYFNEEIYGSSASSVPINQDHAIVASLFNLLHVIYTEACYNLKHSDFYRLEVPGFRNDRIPEPSMVVEVPLSIDDITTGALSVIPYCGNHNLRIHAWKRAYHEHLSLTHIQKIE